MEKKPIPPFIPQPGQTDFTNARWAPVLNTVVLHDDMILLVERNPDMRLYPGYWNGISGFLDDNRSLEEKVRAEMCEELGLTDDNITHVELCDVFDQEDPEYNKTWVVHAALALVNTDVVSLDWEAMRHEWVSETALSDRKLMPGFDRVIRATLGRASELGVYNNSGGG